MSSKYAVWALAAILTGAFSGWAMAESEPAKQIIVKNGTQASRQGSPHMFTGAVRQDPMFSATEEAPYNVTGVTFEPGARTFWHVHVDGQRLLIVSGSGLIGEWNGKVTQVNPGDIVWCPPGVKHWHGASPTTSMTHIALTGVIGGKNTEWMEEVTDEQYNGGQE